ALVSTASPLTCGADPGCATALRVVDFVGYGPTAVSSEGNRPASSPGAAQALLRVGNGCTDTGHNATDFAPGQPAPHNSAAPAEPCPARSGTPTGTTPVTTSVHIHDIQG